MQDFDALRHRVEATAQRLTAVQAERHDQTQSLVGILRRLEERHAAQEQQLAYYKERLGPLEQANRHLVGLMENLLDLIDSGFGDESLVPLRNASEMAATMLANDLVIVANPAAIAADSMTAEAEHPSKEVLFRNEDGHDGDVEDNAVGARSLDGMALDDFAADDAVAFEEEGDVDGVTDLELEEDALISLDQLLERASDDSADEPTSFGPATVPGVAASEAVFEDVADAVLELEARENAEIGRDGLPDIVTHAAAAADALKGSGGMPFAGPEDEARELSAIAEALEEGAAGQDAPAPAPSDIRALLRRVEALSKKAEAMRMAHRAADTPDRGRDGPRGARKGKPGPAGAAA